MTRTLQPFSEQILHDAGFGPDVYDQFKHDGHTVTVAAFSLERAPIARSGAGWFDLFVPTRFCVMRAEEGKLRQHRFAYRPGSVGFSPPGVDWRAVPEGRVEGISFFLPPELMDAVAERHLGCCPSGWRHVLADAAPAIAWLAQDIASQVRLGLDPEAGLRSTLCEALLALVCRHYVVSPARQAPMGVHSPAVIRALNYIDDNLSESIDVSSIAQAAFVSPSQLSRLFRHELGVGPWQHVLQRRVERYERLRRSAASASKAVTLSGFPNARAADRALKRLGTKR